MYLELIDFSELTSSVVMNLLLLIVRLMLLVDVDIAKAQGVDLDIYH